MPATQSARERVRAELTREIIDAAKHELAAEGAPGLSIRAVARRLEMVPSALYRYFPNRDALLTALIVDSYEALGAAAAAADPGPRTAPTRRWLAVAKCVRAWARSHPHEWALVYGSPVPGYEAPERTVDAALQVTRVITRIVADAITADSKPDAMPAAPRSLRRVVEPLEKELLPGRSAESVAGALMAWTQLMGTVSLELFGHYKGATTDFDQVFEYTMHVSAALMGL
jgi:AcrR family transcriptional regulator